MASESANETEVWDTDGRIQYSSGWELTEVARDETGQEGTFHSTIISGSTAYFSFYGSQITVNGYVFPGNSTVSARYSLDGGNAVLRTEDSNNGGQTYLSTDLFTSDALPLMRHNITVEVVDTSSPRNYSIIYFLVNGEDQGVIASPSSTISSSQTTSSLISSSVVSGESTTTSQVNPASGSSGVSLGTILGVVFGGVALLISLAAIFFFLRRHRRRKKVEEFYQTGDGNSAPTREMRYGGGAPDRYGAIHPFIVSPGDSTPVTSPMQREKLAGGAVENMGTNRAMQEHDPHNETLTPGSGRSSDAWVQAFHLPPEAFSTRDHLNANLSSAMNDQMLSVNPPAYDNRAPNYTQ